MDILDKFIECAKESVRTGYYDINDAKITKNSFEHVSLLKKIRDCGFILISEIKHASPAGEYSFENIDVEKQQSGLRNVDQMRFQLWLNQKYSRKFEQFSYC